VKGNSGGINGESGEIMASGASGMAII